MTSGQISLDDSIQAERTARVPYKVYKRQQAAVSRRQLYPVTIFYSCYSIVLLRLAFRTVHPHTAIAFYLTGLPVWTFFEYLAHRYVLHFPYFRTSRKMYKRLILEFMSRFHWQHHLRPCDGEHINGELRDLLPMFAVTAPLSFLFPRFTAPMFLAGITQAYVVEEWIHHSVHFYNFRGRYFTYIKKHHFYHHTSPGNKLGYGLTSGFWDRVFMTSYPKHVRERLYGRKAFRQNTEQFLSLKRSR